MNIIILNPYNKFPLTNCWDFELINYEVFIDHTIHNVIYIADERGLSGITADSGQYQLRQIDDFSDSSNLRQVIEEEVQKLAQVDRIIAFSEGHMDMLAELREKYNIPGPGIAETRRARDKIIMKQHVQAANLRVPQFIHTPLGTNLDDISDFVDKVGFPLIFKPTNGASSIGVQKLLNESELVHALTTLDSGNWELEEFIEGKVLHIDGLVNANGDVVFSVPSAYVNTLFDYLHGSPTGSYILERDDPMYDQANVFTSECLKALNFSACPFHLELIVTSKNELVFLETAARVAGADIPYMIADCTGINLFSGWVAMIMGNAPDLSQIEHKAGAWLLFGLPPKLPVEVTKSTGFKGKVDTLYKEQVPEIGSIVTKPRGYCALQAGRFMFAHNDFEKVHADLQHVLKHFEFSAKEAVV
jgi:hypothetical protein